ncbi:Vitamin B12-dependent ribonucleoside-diphosphate reductase [uncultured archaeon]|nr:Vitamin B12-dependent ribonucleoside-diphosphate reductase [uncultured archaeon]
MPGLGNRPSDEQPLKEYELESDGVKLKVKVIYAEGDFVKRYILEVPEFGQGTKALMDNLKQAIILDPNVKAEKMLDPKEVGHLKAAFRDKALAILKRELPSLDDATKNAILMVLLTDMLGMGKIDILLLDGDLEEVVVNNASEPAWVYHKEFGWLKTNVLFDSEEQIQNYANIIARRGGKQITILNPLLDTHLLTGDRANATLFPISGKGNTITIRRFRRDPWTVTDFIRNRTANSDVMALIWMCMQYEMNMILSGGTASGKTSFLNICLPFIQPNHRVLTIEDSVSGDSEIIYRRDGNVTKTTAGEMIDGLIEDDSVNDAIVENDEGIMIPSMTKSGKLEWKEPSHFIRHKVEKDLLKITMKSGREIEVTPDHSLFTLGPEGKIAPLNGSEIKEGSWLATPRQVDWEGSKVTFNLRENLGAFEGCFVKSLEIKELLEENRAALVNSYSKNTINGNCRRGIASVKMVMQLQHRPHAGYITSRLGTKIPLEIEVDEDLACFAGMWLADGCYDKNSVLVSIVEPEARAVVERVAARFGLKTKMHSDGITLMVNSKPVKKLFENVLSLKGNAYTKKMPDWIFSLEKPLAAAVLCGYFSGDGWVRKNDIAIRSSSRQLLKDTQTLLLKFGIPLRVKWRLLKDKTYEARISGTEFLRRYAQEIGFSIDKKTEKASKWLSAKSHDVSDVVPLPKEFYKAIKKARRSEVGKTLTYKSWKCTPYKDKNIGRMMLQKMAANYSEILPAVLGELAFNDVFWDQVESIERREFRGFVYDFSVPENESFICNNILCHNTRELVLPEFLHWVPMTTREPNAEGKGGVTMLNLLVNSLRQRPDRIIVGETRRQSEAEVMFEAMHTGHSVYTTFHANTADETIRRLVNPPMSIPEAQLEAVHLNVVMFRNRRLGMRRVFEVAEFVPEKRGNVETLKANTLYRWHSAGDVISKDAESIRLLDELSLHTGLTYDEIHKDLGEKRAVLEWLVKNDIHDIQDVGKAMAKYYMDRQGIVNAVQKNRKLSDI